MNQNKNLEKTYQKSLITAISEGDSMGVAIVLRDFKTSEGLVNYPAVLSIPRVNRIPELAKNDFNTTIKTIGVALTLAFENMNLKRGMQPEQIANLSEIVIDTASEDNLAVEDLMLFLQKLVRGEYGITYESMDIPKFMNFFEKYREERWQELNRIRMEGHIQNKCSGDIGKNTQPDELSEHFQQFGSRLSQMKDNIQVLKQEVKDAKINNF